MRKVTVVKSSEVEIKPFVLDDFVVQKETHQKLQLVSKKELKSLCKELGLGYAETDIVFAKKLLNAHIKKSL